MNLDLTKPLVVRGSIPLTNVRETHYGFRADALSHPDVRLRYGLAFKADGTSEYHTGNATYAEAPAFDPTKPAQTRDGRPARILATDLKSPMPILAAIPHPVMPAQESAVAVFPSGQFSLNSKGPTDLVNVPEVTVEYLNVYPNGVLNNDDSSTKLFGPFPTQRRAANGLSTNKHGFTIEITRTDGKVTGVELIVA